MSTIRRSVAALTLAGLTAAPLAVLTAAPASAVEREGRCDGAEFQLEVERDNGRFDVDADIDDATPGSKWRVILKHEGRNFYNVQRTADSDGDISVDRTRPNTRGADTFVMKINKVGTGGSCTHRIRFAR